MKNIKIKALAIVMVLLIAIVPMTAFAATGINDNEQQLIDDASAALAGFTLNASQQAKADSMLAQVESYLAGDYELTADQYSTCKAQLDVIVASLPADLSNLSINELYKSTPAISAAIDAVASALGITIDIGSGSVTIVDKGGNNVADTKDPVQQTGVAVEYLMIAAFAFVAVIAACAVVAKKKNLFAAKA